VKALVIQKRERGMFFAATLLLAGCGNRAQTYFPLTLGQETEYAVRIGVIQRADKVKVTGTDEINGKPGFRLEGPSGVTRLAWNGNTLLCAELSGVHFSPALPLFVARETSWKGTIEYAGKTGAGRATIVPKEATYKVGGQEVPAQWMNAAFQGELGEFEFNTLFAKGIGIVRQEEKREGVVVRSCEKN